MAKAMGRTYRAFPLWAGLEPFASQKLVVVHPLGGCPIGVSSTDGVVNANGQVYETKSSGQSVHNGLYVLDASIIPGAVAVNPTLTIVSMGQSRLSCESNLGAYSGPQEYCGLGCRRQSRSARHYRF